MVSCDEDYGDMLGGPRPVATERRREPRLTDDDPELADMLVVVPATSLERRAHPRMAEAA